jgi:hypothetical protein
LADNGDIHPDALVTVKLYVPAARPEMVHDEPLLAIAPGLIVQLPVGKPLSTTLPVARAQVGCVIVPTTGAVGVVGAAVITTLADVGDTHPADVVTVKLYVPAASPVMVLVEPVPAIAPGFIVQLPAGKPLRITLPVGRAQVGWVMAPTAGADGVTGWAIIVTIVAVEIQPVLFFAVTL